MPIDALQQYGFIFSYFIDRLEKHSRKQGFPNLGLLDYDDLLRRCDHPVQVTYWIARGANVNSQTSKGCTPLMLACMGYSPCSTELVQALIDAGANVNAIDKYRQTALFYTIESESIDLIRLLLKRGANINHEDDLGRNVLLFAINCCAEVDMIKLLLRHQAKDKRGKAKRYLARILEE